MKATWAASISVANLKLWKISLWTKNERSFDKPIDSIVGFFQARYMAFIQMILKPMNSLIVNHLYFHTSIRDNTNKAINTNKLFFQ
jgi:hypothetical protein